MTAVGEADHPDRFADSEAKQFVSLEEAISLSQTLGKKISGLSPRPEIAIGLANGGILPAAVAARTAGIECRIVNVSRKSSRIKRKLGLIKHILPLPSAVLASRPVKALGLRLDRRFGQLEENARGADIGGNLSGRDVVIVDDCVDSGSTVAHVRSKLLASGAATVQVAVISWATKFDSLALHAVAPDVHLHRVIHRYPWALSNPEYGRFEQWLRDEGYRPWK